MEKWKIAVIAALFLSLVGYSIYQDQPKNPQAARAETTFDPAIAQATPGPSMPSKWLGKPLPAWTKIKQWNNTSTPPSLALLKGNVVLLEIFRIECPHCQDAAPFMAAINQQYGPAGLKMVAIESPSNRDDLSNPEADWKTVSQWLKDRKYTWPAGFDKHGDWFQDTLKGNTFPSIFLLDKNGKVVYFQAGHDTAKAANLNAHLHQLFPGANLKAEQIEEHTN